MNAYERFDQYTLLAHKMGNAYLRRTRARHAADDIRQSTLVGLWKACLRYDPAQGVPFRAFAAICIKAELLDDARRAFGRSHQVRFEKSQCSFAKLLRQCDNGDAEEPAFLRSPETPDAVALRDEAEALLANLSERAQFVLRAHYMDGRTFREIADDIGTHTSRAHQIAGESIEQLRLAQERSA